MIEWIGQAAWLSARHLSLAISSVGDLTAPGVSYLIIYLRSSLGLPTEVDPDRIYRKGKVMWIVFPKTLPSFVCFVSGSYYRGLIHTVRMLAVQKFECQPFLDSFNPSTCSPVGNPSASVRIAFAELEHTHTLTPTSRAVTLGMKHRGLDANLIVFRSSVRHWMPIVPARVLSGCSRCECVSVGPI